MLCENNLFIDASFLQDEHDVFDLYSISSLKQQSISQQVTTHGHVILPQTLKQQSISQQVTTHGHVILPQTLKQQSTSQHVTTLGHVILPQSHKQCNL